MFDIGWSELLVLAVVAILVVGPKDLPRLLRSIGKYVGKIRSTANDFRRQFDDAMRESELQDIRDSVDDLKSMDPLKDVRNSIGDVTADAQKFMDDDATSSAGSENAFTKDEETAADDKATDDQPEKTIAADTKIDANNNTKAES